MLILQQIADWFNEDTLKKYSAVIFLNTADNKDAAFELLRRKQLLNDIYRRAEDLLACIQLQIQNTIGDGMEDWLEVFLTAIPKNISRLLLM